MSQTIVRCPVRAVTSGSPHFFGYYDKCPWSADGKRLLAMRAPFQDRPPRATDPLMLGTVELATGRYEPFAETMAWNWQQGSMLQWLPGGEVIYNARRDGQLIAVIHDLATGRKRELPRPIYAVHPNGKEAISLDFQRLQTYRPGYGYPPGVAEVARDFAPANVGLWRMDLESGKNKLILSIAEAREFQKNPHADGVPNWFNHVTYSPDGSRFCFLHRFRHEDRNFGSWFTRFFTMQSDGSELYLLNGSGMTSHFAWRDPKHLIAWCWQPAGEGMKAGYWLMKDQTQEAEAVGEKVFTRDGHMTYSPDGQWLLTDEYQGADNKQPLMLLHLASGRLTEVGRFDAPLRGETRCDLHPRWSRDGKEICFDSTHERVRQVYVVDVGQVVGE